MSQLSPLFPSTRERPEWHFTKSLRTKSIQNVAIRDNFYITTWVCIGGIIQGIALLAFGSLALIPAAMLLIFRTLDVLLQTTGTTKDRTQDGVITKKFGAQLPHEDGSFGSKPGERGLVVFIVGIDISHPLGILAPGAKKNGKLFEGMTALLDKYYDKNGLLGYSNWLSMDEAAGNKTILIMYWRDIESLHHFAHSPDHMAGVRWWANEASMKYPHIGVFHETYKVPEGHFENVYLGCKPFLMAGTTVPVFSTSATEGARQLGEKSIIGWQRPIVDSKRGPLRTFARRIQRSDMAKHEMEDGDVWDKTHLEDRTS